MMNAISQAPRPPRRRARREHPRPTADRRSRCPRQSHPDECPRAWLEPLAPKSRRRFLLQASRELWSEHRRPRCHPPPVSKYRRAVTREQRYQLGQPSGAGVVPANGAVATGNGSRTVKLLPFPMPSLCTITVPPCKITSSLSIERPSPIRASFQPYPPSAKSGRTRKAGSWERSDPTMDGTRRRQPALSCAFKTMLENPEAIQKA